MRAVGLATVWLPVVAWGLWAGGAVLWTDGGPSGVRVLVLLLALALVVGVAVTAREALAPLLAMLLLTASFWFASRTPRADRPWRPEQSRMPRVASFAEGFTVHDQRAFRWSSPTEATPGWATESYRYDALVGADLGISRFSELEAMAHVFVSFRFDDGRVLVASVEVRKEEGESFHPVRGLYKHYEKMVVLGDERDLVHLRAVVLEERVELHPLDVPVEQVEVFLRSVLDEAEELHQTPRWYHTVLASCSTSLSTHLRRMGALPLDHRVLFPGYADQLAHELGWLGGRPLAELREAHRVDLRARELGEGGDFSAGLRR